MTSDSEAEGFYFDLPLKERVQEVVQVGWPSVMHVPFSGRCCNDWPLRGRRVEFSLLTSHDPSGKFNFEVDRAVLSFRDLLVEVCEENSAVPRGSFADDAVDVLEHLLGAVDQAMDCGIRIISDSLVKYTSSVDFLARFPWLDEEAVNMSRSYFLTRHPLFYPVGRMRSELSGRMKGTRPFRGEGSRQWKGKSKAQYQGGLSSARLTNTLDTVSSVCCRTGRHWRSGGHSAA